MTLFFDAQSSSIVTDLSQYDVNKRTARLVANIPLIKRNLKPLSFIDVRQKDYVISLLGVHEKNDDRANFRSGKVGNNVYTISFTAKLKAILKTRSSEGVFHA